jgi:transposase
VIEAKHGIPVAAAVDAANVSEVHLGPAALAMMLVMLPFGSTTVLADRAYDSDPLREEMELQDFELVAAHRKNRVKPPTNDGRTLRKLKRRWKVERTFAWLHSFRRVVTRFEKRIDHFEGFVNLGCAFIALGKLTKQVTE